MKISRHREGLEVECVCGEQVIVQRNLLPLFAGMWGNLVWESVHPNCEKFDWDAYDSFVDECGGINCAIGFIRT